VPLSDEGGGALGAAFQIARYQRPTPTASMCGWAQPGPPRRPVYRAGVMDRIDYFARLVDEDPTVARARFGYANELLRAERWEDAIVQLRAYLELAEDEGNGWQRLGEALTKAGRPDEAADAYLTGIDQSLKHGHTGMADDLQAAIEAL
jgi:tetratricopeptide (TPR) repeat protein